MLPVVGAIPPREELPGWSSPGGRLEACINSPAGVAITFAYPNIRNPCIQVSSSRLPASRSGCRFINNSHQGESVMTQPHKPHVVFVCVENSNRSQMAEGFARLHGGDLIEAFSSGSRPSGVVNPKAVAAMKEKGVDLAVHRSKGLDELPDVEWEYAITMGCGDECPMLRARHRTDWALPDPKHMEPDKFNEVRDEIERRVLELLRTIRTTAGA